MTSKETIKALRKFRSYLTTKGKKYPLPGCPEWKDALDFAITELAYYLDKYQFTEMANLANRGVATLKKEEMSDGLRDTIRAYRRVVSKMQKQNG